MFNLQSLQFWWLNDLRTKGTTTAVIRLLISSSFLSLQCSLSSASQKCWTPWLLIFWHSILNELTWQFWCLSVLQNFNKTASVQRSSSLNLKLVILQFACSSDSHNWDKTCSVSCIPPMCKRVSLQLLFFSDSQRRSNASGLIKSFKPRFNFWSLHSSALVALINEIKPWNLMI